MRIRNFFLDYFNKRNDKRLVHLGVNLSTVVNLTCLDEKTFKFNFYKVVKGGLRDLGFSFKLGLMRVEMSEEKVFKAACSEKQKEIKMLKERFTRNSSKNSIGETVGRVYMQR